MTPTDCLAELLLQKLRRVSPLAAHGRPQLTLTLRRRFPHANVMARLTVSDVFYAGEEKGLMCRIDMHGTTGQPDLLVAPITHLAFGRQHPMAREIAAYQKSRHEFGAPIAAPSARRETLAASRGDKSPAKPREFSQQRSMGR